MFKKVAAVNKKNGPFDLLLCVGQFFEEASRCMLLLSSIRQLQMGMHPC